MWKLQTNTTLVDDREAFVISRLGKIPANPVTFFFGIMLADTASEMFDLYSI